jgi:ATP-dependent Clp protease ATP-binding subunit ClpC
VGARDIAKGKSLGFHSEEAARGFERMSETIRDELQKVFNPEFLNRLDDVIVFHPLDRTHIAKIVTIMLHEVELRLGDEIHLTPQALDFLVQHGYDESYGARPLRRAIQRFVEDPLSERLLTGDLVKGDEIEMDVASEGDHLVFRTLTGTKA